MQIFYGVDNIKIDITNTCYQKLFHNDHIIIVNNDNRRPHYFGDPKPNVVKKIYINYKNVETEYDHNQTIYINTKTFNITTESHLKTRNDLQLLYQNIKYKNNLVNDQQLQLMVLNNLKGNEKILEIGFGLHSIIISKLLNIDSQHVILEPNEELSNIIQDIKSINNCNFNYKTKLLTNKTLIQRCSSVVESSIVYPGYTQVNNISLEELNNTYNINFDTLVIDCSKGFYYTILDYPELLNNINMIIIVNNYQNMDQYLYVENIFKKFGFLETFSNLANNKHPCFIHYYQVWKKI